MKFEYIKLKQIRPFVRFTISNTQLLHTTYVVPLEHRLIYVEHGKADAWIDGKINKEYYSIPYRSLITKKVPNLATAGRTISADHVAMSSTRIQGTAMLTGQEAGVAAAMAVSANCSMGEVDVKKLQKKLINDGVFLKPLEF